MTMEPTHKTAINISFEFLSFEIWNLKTHTQFLDRNFLNWKEKIVDSLASTQNSADAQTFDFFIKKKKNSSKKFNLSYFMYQHVTSHCVLYHTYKYTCA